MRLMIHLRKNSFSNAYKLMWLLFAALLFFTPLAFSALTEESFEFPKMDYAKMYLSYVVRVIVY